MGSTMERALVAVGLGGFVMILARPAMANKYGELHITHDTTLTDHQYGSVIFDADNITLDCDNKQVHISSFTKNNCHFGGEDGVSDTKCAIVAKNRTNVKVRNCAIVGGFHYGLYFLNTAISGVSLVSASGGCAHGFLFASNQDIYANTLLANGTTETGVLVYRDVRGQYNNVTSASAGYYGIALNSSDGTSFYSAGVGYSADAGFWANQNTNVSLDVLDVEQSGGMGLAIYGPSSGVSVTNSVFRWNNDYSLYVEDADDAYFAGNSVSGNSPCSAYQDAASTGNVWQGNYLEAWCGTIPNSH
jgi:hypothetical protein